MADSSTSLVASEYHAPQLLLNLGTMLRFPRQAYGTQFSDIFSTSLDEQREYGRGIVAIGSFFVCLWVIWIFTLVVLKLKGQQVGCASGRAFQLVKVEEEEDLQVTDSSSGEYSTGIEEHHSRVGEFPVPEYDNEGQEVELSDYGDCYDGENDSRSSWSSEEYQKNAKRRTEWHPKLREHPRERKTRLTFIFFSFLSLLMVPFVLLFSYGPMKGATEDSKQMMLQANDIMISIVSSFEEVADAGRNADAIMQAMPRNLTIICPLVDPTQMKSELGIDLGELKEVVFEDYPSAESIWEDRLAFYNHTVEKVQTSITSFEYHVETAESFMWIVPGLLCSISILAAICMISAVLAWKQKSSDNLSKAMSYIALPILIVLSIGCWAVLILSSFGTILTSDMCTTSGSGSPETTVHEILAMRQRTPNDSIYQLVDIYTNNCQGVDPTFHISELEKEIQDIVDNIWRQVSIIDSIGRARLLEQCGGTNLIDFISASRDIAKLLTAIRRSLRSASGQLKCDHLNPIYTETVHVTLCTDAALASSYGFVMFFILSISTMIMITLRTSWLKSTGDEEKVYQDENEIAENMIVNEHEEYLAYISKYNHEWQEYNGFEHHAHHHRRSVINRHNDLRNGYNNENFEEFSLETLEEEEMYATTEDEASKTDGEGYHGSDECSDDVSDSHLLGLNVDIFPTLGPLLKDEDDNDNAISFPSLQDYKTENVTDVSSPSLKEKNYDFGRLESRDLAFGISPQSSLLSPPAENPEYSKSEFLASAPPLETSQLEPEGRDADSMMEATIEEARNDHDAYIASINNFTFSDTEKESDAESEERGLREDFLSAVLPPTPESQRSIVWM